MSHILQTSEAPGKRLPGKNRHGKHQQKHPRRSTAFKGEIEVQKILAAFGGQATDLKSLVFHVGA